MIDDIDYKALCERLQHELEQARITILTMRNTTGVLDKVNADSIRAFASKNYGVIILAIMLLSFIVSSLKTLKGLFTKP